MTEQQTTASEAQKVSSEVGVAVDPAVAFKAFTEELDLWFVRGPINFHNAGRIAELRCETGVGGRILEVLDDPVTGEMFEIARITAWEPPARLAFASSLDDVATEVRFVSVAGGTRVVVEHTIPAGGADRGGTAWSRVMHWFENWCRRRDTAPHRPDEIARLALALHYRKPLAAARWLAGAFGMEPTNPLPEGTDPMADGHHGPPWLELRAGNASLMIFELEGEAVSGEPTHVPWLYVDDFDAHLARAERQGVRILESREWPQLPTYVAEDLEGNRWTFAQARPTQ